MADLNLCVLGAGVVGLTTAVQLQNEFRNATVTVLAEKFNIDTTSFVAPGVFYPSLSFAGPTEDVTREWIRSSYYHWNDLYNSYGGPQVGILEASGYIFSSVDVSSVRNYLVENLLPVYRRATEEELKICPGNWKYGSFLSSYVIENGIYLPWATSKFLNNNGRIVRKRIDELSELAGKYDVVINCTGLGARFLCRDIKLVPIRGQILKVNAPWIDKFYFTDSDTYIIPGFEGTTLGGTRNYESYNLNWNKYDELDIKDRCEALIPKLRHAEVVARRVGLRPHRTPVRVESEIISVYESKIKIVHNYGHGGYGVTSAPGTAKHAVKLVREMLMTKGKL